MRILAALRHRSAWFWTVVLVVYLVALTAASVQPASAGAGSAAGRSFRVFTNLMHGPAYAVLAAVWGAQMAALAPGRLSRLAAALWGAALALGWGIGLEIVQWRFVHGRYGSVGDVLLDAAGVAVAVVGAALLVRRRAREEAQEGASETP